MFFRVHFLGEGGMGDNTEGALSELLLKTALITYLIYILPEKLRDLDHLSWKNVTFTIYVVLSITVS